VRKKTTYIIKIKHLLKYQNESQCTGNWTFNIITNKYRYL